MSKKVLGKDVNDSVEEIEVKEKSTVVEKKEDVAAEAKTERELELEEKLALAEAEIKVLGKNQKTPPRGKVEREFKPKLKSGLKMSIKFHEKRK